MRLCRHITILFLSAATMLYIFNSNIEQPASQPSKVYKYSVSNPKISFFKIVLKKISVSNTLEIEQDGWQEDVIETNVDFDDCYISSPIVNISSNHWGYYIPHTLSHIDKYIKEFDGQLTSPPPKV